MQGEPLTTTVMRRLLGGLMLVLSGLAACQFDSTYGDTEYRCDESGVCPDGQICQSGVCRPDPTQCGTLAAAKEDFDRLDLTQIDRRRWHYWSDKPEFITVDDGQLVFSLPADAHGVGAGFGTQPVYALTGSAATVEIMDISMDHSTTLALELYARDGSRASLSYRDETLYAVYRGGADPEILASLPYAPSAHRFWRVRESDDNLLWESSADGVEFTEHASRAVSDFGPWVGAYINLRKEHTSPERVTVALDDLNGMQSSAPLCASATMTDDFDDGKRGTQWQVYEFGECKVRETDGRLGFEFPDSGAHECILQSTALYDLSASTITVEAPLEDVDGIEQCLKVFLPHGDDVEFELRDGKLRGEKQLDGDKDTVFSVEFDPRAHRFWRLRGDGSALYWEVSPDGREWQLMGSHLSPALDIESVSISLIGDADDGKVENLGMSFDNLNLLP